MKIATVVILYHPDHSLIESIPVYLDHTLEVILVDNSIDKDQQLIESLLGLGNVTYLDNKGNQGLAAALNVGINAAVAKGYNWVLTMDQDSKFSAEMLERFISCVSSLNTTAAIYTPYHLLTEGMQERSGIQEVNSCMTSGNLLNLGAYQRCGPFLEKLFIDYVDHEYCLRLRKAAYKIIQVNDVRLTHQLGNFKTASFFGKRVSVSNHSPVRRYYISRNRVYLISKYLFFDMKFCLNALMNIFLRDPFRILMFEDHKLEKCSATLKGIGDALTGKYGAYK
jgi:rhamnosyltransferase